MITVVVSFSSPGRILTWTISTSVGYINDCRTIRRCSDWETYKPSTPSGGNQVKWTRLLEQDRGGPLVHSALLYVVENEIPFDPSAP